MTDATTTEFTGPLLDMVDNDHITAPVYQYLSTIRAVSVLSGMTRDVSHVNILQPFI
jgi:hypothetical protein